MTNFIDLDIHELGTKGREWVKESLSDGLSLSREVLRSMPLERGSAYALGLNQHTLIDDSMNFKCSIIHIYPSIFNSSKVTEYELLKLMGEIYPTAVLLAEDNLRNPNDPRGRQFPVDEICSYSDEMFHIHDVDKFESLEAMGRFIGEAAFGYPLNAFVLIDVSVDAVQKLISEGSFSELAQKVCMSFHSIFDADATCAWIDFRYIERLAKL